MSELQQIEATLEKTARRRRWQRAWSTFWRGLLIGGSLWLLVVILYKVLPVPFEVLPISGAVCGIIALIAFIIGWYRKPGLNEMARWVDSQTHLQERLSTALEVAKTAKDSEWRRLVVSDAATRAQQLDPRKLLPFRLPSASRWALLVLALSAGLGFVPEYRSKEYVQKKAEAQIIKEVGRQVAELTKRQLDARPPALQPTQKAMESVAELGQKLQNAKLTRNDALRELANLTDKLKEQTRELASQPAFKRMEEAARMPSQENGRPGDGLQKQMDALQKALGDKAADPAKLEKLAKELKKLQEAAQGLADKSAQNGEGVREQISQSLSQLSKEIQNMGLSVPEMEQAMQALAANQTDLMMKDLNAAMTDLQKLTDMAKSLQQMQAQAERMGKDLAEQLKNGQAEAAQSTLQKMIEQLKSGNISQEQLQKMMSEVSKAVDPAGQYGKVAQFLKDAGKQLKQGQQQQGAQSLADAKKELEDLMKQMGDAQNLMAELKALQKASMCVGNCEGWGQGPGKGGFNPKGSKAGKGVGTWTDEDGWLYTPEITERWDNSGIVRPDMDARGHTDRGDGELADGLQSTKIKGQISPGGSMPSITLKGVSIKGTSSVSYEEAASAAQSEAQSALSQEKVPRAYQGAVKDYFDDLKK